MTEPRDDTAAHLTAHADRPADRPADHAADHAADSAAGHAVDHAADRVRAAVEKRAPKLADSLHQPVGDDPIAAPASPVSAWNLANALTVFRLVLVPVFLLVLFVDDGASAAWRVGAWAVFAVASATDRLDGELARRRNLVTEFGKLADPIADKALAGAALIGLSALAQLPWWVTVVILVREVAVTLLRFWVIRHGVLAASRGGKLKTLLQAVAIGLFLLPPYGWLRDLAWVVMIAAIVIALATGLDYVGRAVRLRREPSTVS